jgi:hypothetical protein
MQRSVVISAFAVLLAAVSIAVSIVALERKPTASLSRQVHELASEVSSGSAQATMQQARMTKLLTCIPELVGEINGLTPEALGAETILVQHSQISSYCQSILEASGR